MLSVSFESEHNQESRTQMESLLLDFVNFMISLQISLEVHKGTREGVRAHTRYACAPARVQMLEHRRSRRIDHPGRFEIRRTCPASATTLHPSASLRTANV